ncbi:Tyrosine-protein phosphatase non-receptor type 6 [Thelohanellus kitauei]|uniref:Tyrosine-protein phosphatase non-receptor type 6 n=1 Tax=Thelohanellus kitauei TaxID=669202 RepID=A0A0C2I715_THEKT|nr:Tyrosine-protein phosphatase non-receptor type 6 [Thelohanellus kitauei]
MSEEGEFKIAIRTEFDVSIIDIHTNRKGYTIDFKQNFKSIEELVVYYQKYAINSSDSDYDRRLPKPYVCSAFHASMISQRIETLRRNEGDSNERQISLFIQEYSDLDRISKRSVYFYSEATKANARGKNRYSNILAYDHTRVKLMNCEDDYINANYVNADFQTEAPAYILCQAPTEKTIDDMWRMIIQESVKTIVILTGLIESSGVKCEKYWPDLNESRKLWDEYKVTTVEEDICANIDTITVAIAKNDGSLNFECKLYHYKTWPDHGVPKQSWTVLKLITILNERREIYPNSTTVVHCSAGVGRTGTFVVLDIILNQIKNRGVSTVIDIKEALLKLRKQRAALVQSCKQYEFIYTTIKTYIDWRLGHPKYLNLQMEPDNNENK